MDLPLLKHRKEILQIWNPALSLPERALQKRNLKKLQTFIGSFIQKWVHRIHRNTILHMKRQDGGHPFSMRFEHGGNTDSGGGAGWQEGRGRAGRARAGAAHRRQVPYI
jgi:hypothetical protein